MIREASRQLTFITPHAGLLELTDDEHKLAVRSLSELVDNTLLACAAAVETSNFTTAPNESYVALETRYSDESRLYFDVRSKEIAIGSLLSTKEISVHEFGPDNGRGAAYSYSYEPGSSKVTRSDVYPKSSETQIAESTMKDAAYWQMRRELIAAMTKGELVAEGSKLLEQLLASKLLERQLGINHLPVRYQETVLLTGLVSTAKVVKY